MSANLKKLRPYDQAPRSREPLVPGAPDSAATLWLVVAGLWFLISAGLGTLWLVQQMLPDARLQMHFALPFHLNIWVIVEADRSLAAFRDALVYGWLTNAAIGAIWFITPRLTGRHLVSDMGANVALGLWNLAVLLGLGSIFLGILPGTGPLAEFPFPVAALGALALLMVNGFFWATVAPALGRGAYVSLHYFGIGLLALLVLFVAQSVAPLLNLGQVPAALVNGFYLRALESYWLLGAAVATLYYLVPRATGNPLYSGGAALLGWVLWLVLSLLSGLAALLDPSVPYPVTTIGSVAVMLLVLHAFLVAGNLFLTIRGRWTLAMLPGPLAFALVAIAFVVGTSLLEAAGALRSVQQLVVNTDWQLGVVIFGSFGAYSLAALGLIGYALPRTLRRAWGVSGLAAAELWATWAGAAIAGGALVLGGLAQASLLAQQAAPDAINGTLVWFRAVAFLGIGLVAIGALVLVVDLFLMYTSARTVTYDVAATPVSATAPAAGNSRA
jgi:cbb3-type cytochrome oxidase subunit 1